MHDSIESSRRRFEEYREHLAERGDEPTASPHATGPSPHGGRRPKGKRVRSTSQLLKEFWRLLRGHRTSVAWALGTLTVSTVLGLIPPAATKFVVDNVLGGQPLPASLPFVRLLPTDRWSLLIVVTIVVVSISFIKVGLHISGRWAATRTTKRLQLGIRKQLFEHAVRLPLPRVQELKSGGMASLLREDTAAIGELIFGLLYNPWRAIVQLVGSLCILAFVDWRLLLGAVLILPAVFISHRTWIREIRPRFRDVRARRQEIDGQTTEIFGGIRIVRAFGRQRTETHRIMTSNHLMGRQELYVWWWMRTIEVIWGLLIPLATGGLLLYGGAQVLGGTLTVGDLMMFLVYLVMLLEPLAILAESAAGLQNGLSAFDRVLDVMHEDREMPAGASAVRLNKADVRGHITFENVVFQYAKGDNKALDGIDLDVPAGMMIALVGPSGAGKTTLTNLAARFYDPTSGRVLLDGHDLREIDVESYRQLLGVVEQDVFLFDGTIAENIGYANREASDQQIIEAARVANAHEFISELPLGYETLIGERGVKLSGGQRQRLAIARAVLSDPRILILDEATSNLDTESERLIQQSLHTLLKGRTSFVIAHRLSTIRDADLIVVLDRGKIVESGTHAELLALGGRYRRMVELQASFDVECVMDTTA